MTSFALTIEVQPKVVQLSPGGLAQVAVTVKNTSDVVEHYGVTIAGLPSQDLWMVEPAVTKLRPGESGTIQVRFRLPTKGGMKAGNSVLGVIVSSTSDPEIGRSADLMLEVSAVHQISLEAAPATAVGRGSGEYDLTLTNGGNLDEPVSLSATDELGQAKFSFTQPSLYLPWQSEPQRVQMRFRTKPLLTGQERQSRITIKAVAGEAHDERQVTFVNKPLISPAVFRVLGIVLGLVVVAAAIAIPTLVAGRAKPAESSSPTSSGGSSAQTPTPGDKVSTSTPESPPPPDKPTISSVTVSPEKPQVNNPATLTAAGSAGLQGWSWEIKDPLGVITNPPAAGPQLTHTFPTTGAYVVTVKAVDATNQPATMEAEVTVVEQPPKFKISTAETEVATGSHETVPVQCDDGMVALGGGVGLDSSGGDPPILEVSRSRISPSALKPDRWIGVARNDGSTPVTVRTTVICAVEPPRFDWKRGAEPADAGQPLDVQQACPGDAVVFGGGGGFDDAVRGTLEESAPLPDGTGWRVRASNDSGTAEPLPVQVACGTRPEGDEYKIVSESKLLPAGTRQSLSPRCPPGMQVISGGVSFDPASNRDPAARMKLRQLTPLGPDGSGAQGWLSEFDLDTPVEQSVVAYSICAVL